MCMLCIEIAKQTMTNKEILRAVGESMKGSSKKHTEHLLEIVDRVMATELPVSEVDLEMETLYENERNGKK